MAKTPNARTWSLPAQSNGRRYSDTDLFIPPPAAPTLVSRTTTSVTMNAVAPTWSGPALTQCLWYRDGVKITASPVAFGNFTDSNPVANATHAYTVAAVDSGGIAGDRSPALQAGPLNTDSTAPTAPTIAAAATSQTAIRVSLSAAATDASGIASYRLERKLSTGSSWTVLSSAAVFPYDDTGLAAGTSYDYRARATDASPAANVGPYSVTASATTQSATVTDPVWSTVPAVKFAFGTPSNFALPVTDPQNDPLTLTLATGTLPAGVTLDSANRRLVYNGSGAVASASGISIDASDDPAVTPLSDWVSRSTGPGVIWAQRFTQDLDVNRFLGANTPNKTTAAAFIRRSATDGILGDGCMEHFFPQGGLPQYGWVRPLFPIASAGDVNNAGLPVINDGLYGTTTGQFPTSVYPGAFVNYNGGSHFVHPDYLISANQGWSKPGGIPQPQILRQGPFWIQFRVKFSATRFNSAEASGKFFMITGWYANCQQEIVLQARTEYGGGWFEWYTSVGSNFNSQLRKPEEGSPQSIQPGGAYGLTCLNDGRQIGGGAGNCFVYPTETWVTMMIKVTPGRQFVTSSPGWSTAAANAPARTTGLQVLAALPGATSWTVIADVPDFIFYFDGDYLGAGSAQPWGWSVVNFTPFNGGASAQPVVNAAGWYHRFDQIICSTQAIPLPKY